jgi:hypothetical protein
MPDFVYGDLQVTFLNTKYAQMAKMWDTRTPQESKFKHILQHIPVKNTPSISILKKTFFYICHITNRQQAIKHTCLWNNKQ